MSIYDEVKQKLSTEIDEVEATIRRYTDWEPTIVRTTHGDWQAIWTLDRTLRTSVAWWSSSEPDVFEFAADKAIESVRGKTDIAAAFSRLRPTPAAPAETKEDAT